MVQIKKNVCAFFSSPLCSALWQRRFTSCSAPGAIAETDQTERRNRRTPVAWRFAPGHLHKSNNVKIVDGTSIVTAAVACPPCWGTSMIKKKVSECNDLSVWSTSQISLRLICAVSILFVRTLWVDEGVNAMIQSTHDLLTIFCLYLPSVAMMVITTGWQKWAFLILQVKLDTDRCRNETRTNNQ